ncbi:hypothetical protein [Stutzerimonas stutzeri]|uniref:ORC-CDC6 family AAA ATPase n=1 Tax=Stutzerimonas stutzeri TaxID=316 RepID=UPI003AF348AF
MDQKVGNPFENDNARNSTPEDLPYQFVWTTDFARLISPKNHVLIGARGSGKTAIIKMLSHEYLSRLNHESALKLVRDKSFIGTYVPMRLSWVGGLKNKPWLTEKGRENHFQWRLNVACCSAFISTIESCLRSYVTGKVESIVAERDLCLQLSAAWFPDTPAESIDTLRQNLAEVEYRKLLDEEKLRVNEGVEFSKVGVEFDIGLFEPLKRAIAILKNRIKFPQSAIWAVCLDEAEYLSVEYQRILNSHLRTFADGLVFKITTMPYKHYTLDTNTAVPLVRGDDFDYIYLDSMEVSKRTLSEYESLRKFSTELFERRLKGSRWEKSGVTLEMLLGTSYILSEKSVPQDVLIELIAKHSNEKTLERAKYLLGTSKFDDEIGRKLKGALLLRDASAQIKGNSSSTIYSGVEMVIRCSDGNPRRFISLLNSMYLAGTDETGFKPVPPSVQDRILRHFSTTEFRRIISEPNHGNDIHNFLLKIGKFFKDALHFKPLSSDLILSFRYNMNDDSTWDVVSEAVGVGLIRPLVEKSDFDELPVREGTFRLSYMLSPYFSLLPRRGRAISLSTVLNSPHLPTDQESQMELL